MQLSHSVPLLCTKLQDKAKSTHICLGIPAQTPQQYETNHSFFYALTASHLTIRHRQSMRYESLSVTVSGCEQLTGRRKLTDTLCCVVCFYSGTNTSYSCIKHTLGANEKYFRKRPQDFKGNFEAP